ncbi:MAG TPA: ABC transporter permease [Candidatus Cloacimonadota bacterium]|nr:ABC transporter permease [Candidatus Cloacimonadota bacterium]HPS38776.1 ABC transporter permease [Candidatus Cloacimonadota bacterium]
MNKLDRFFLTNYLKHPKRNLLRFSFIFMVLGIIVSVGILSAGLNLFEGYERTLKSVLLDSFAHINIQSSNNEYLTESQYNSAMSMLKGDPRFLNVSPTISYSAMVQEGSQVRGALIRGFDFSLSFPYHPYIIPLNTGLDTGEIFVGYHMAKELGKSIGDTIRVVYPQLDRISALGLFPSEYPYKIKGLYRSGYYEFDRSIVIMNKSDCEQMIMTSNRYSRIEVRLKPDYTDKAGSIADEYAAKLGGSFLVAPWTISNVSLFRLIAMEKWLIFIIFSFLVLIAGLNVVSAVITIIIDKKNEIAILKTIGTDDRSIQRMLYYRIALVAFAAIVLGLIFGLLLSVIVVNQNFYTLKGDVYFIDKLTVYVSPFNQLIIFSVSALLIMLCISIPLRRINKLEIIELIRNP